MKCTEAVEEMCAKKQHPVKRICHNKAPKYNQKVQWQCDGRHGVVHTSPVSCHVKKPKCDTCTKIEATEQAVKEKMEVLEAEQKRWENKMRL